MTWLAAGGLALLCACAVGTQQVGRVIDAGRIAEVEVGRSTKADVLRIFGPPSSYARLPAVPDPGERTGLPDATSPPGEAADVFVYEYREDRERFLTTLFFTRFRREVLSDRLVVFFDEDDVVEYLAFARQTDAGPEAPASP